MENLYCDKMYALGFDQLICNIFIDWENVKDELLLPDRKSGSGNGTVHVFLGAADSILQKEFHSYYEDVNNNVDPSKGAVEITHYFLPSNIISMIGYVCQYYHDKKDNFDVQIKNILSNLSAFKTDNGMFSTTSLLKLSTGSNKLRPYFKQFESNGVFTKLIRPILVPNSAYKISLYKDKNGNYAAFWLIGSESLTDFEANSSTEYTVAPKRKQILFAYSLQQIYYGAPGTGKSHSINEQTEGESVIRTTFHPDSDYSTFVGAYKPTTKEVELRDVTGHKVMENGKVVTEDRIVYEFVDQAFLQAYVNAWKFYAENEEEPKKQFLVIEEINRGNCAQIFGDLFQLLDRNEWGFSDYPINADKDMKKQLKKALAGLSIADAETINGLYKGRDVVKEVLEGDILLLLNNLYIWATMNTSDQSLFPIDSAFKRRWDWQYMPIAQGRDEAGRELVWTIDINGIKYSWWSFLEKINAQIGEATQSEDKKLGFFFCKAKDGVITPETFVGKVVFYLWNDVFKDYGFEGSIFKDKDGTELSFNKFYAADLKGNAVVQKDKVELFLNNLGVEVFKDGNIPSEESEEDEDGNQALSPSTGRDYTKFSINGVGNYAKNNLAAECVKKYIELNPTKTAEEVLNDWRSLGNIVPHFIESKEQYDARTDNSKRSHEIACGGAVIYVAHNGYGNNGKVLVLMDAVNQKDWGITIQKNV